MFDTALRLVLLQEGGYCFDPRDPGGETKFGISKRSYPDLNIAELSLEQASEIYRRDYWIKYRCGELRREIAALFFDGLVNQGPSIVKLLQKAAGVSADGVVGPATIKACNDCEPGVLCREFAALRMQRYIGTKGFDVFGWGWTKRLFDVAIKAATQK